MAMTITEFAKEKINSLLAKRQTPNDFLRIGVQSGGCSGFSYFYDFVEKPREGDKILEFKDVNICVDKKSWIFLNGTEIDYEDTLFKSGIIFKNPQAKRTCGCGESISF